MTVIDFNENRGHDQDHGSPKWWQTVGFHVRPTAIYANPVLLDLIDQEMKSEYNVNNKD